MLAEVVAVFLTGPATSISGFQNALPVVRWVGLVYLIVLASALLRFTWKSALNVFLAITAVVLGLLLGPLGGLIPLAVLTTRHRQRSSTEVAGVFE